MRGIGTGMTDLLRKLSSGNGTRNERRSAGTNEPELKVLSSEDMCNVVRELQQASMANSKGPADKATVQKLIRHAAEVLCATTDDADTVECALNAMQSALEGRANGNTFLRLDGVLPSIVMAMRSHAFQPRIAAPGCHLLSRAATSYAAASTIMQVRCLPLLPSLLSLTGSFCADAIALARAVRSARLVRCSFAFCTSMPAPRMRVTPPAMPWRPFPATRRLSQRSWGSRRSPPSAKRSHGLPAIWPLSVAG